MEPTAKSAFYGGEFFFVLVGGVAATTMQMKGIKMVLLKEEISVGWRAFHLTQFRAIAALFSFFPVCSFGKGKIVEENKGDTSANARNPTSLAILCSNREYEKSVRVRNDKNNNNNNNNRCKSTHTHTNSKMVNARIFYEYNLKYLVTTYESKHTITLVQCSCIFFVVKSQTKKTEQQHGNSVHGARPIALEI